MVYLVLVFVCLFVYSLQLDFEVIDLSHTIGPTTISLPINPAFNFTVLERNFNERYRIWIEGNWFGMSEHTLTHVDAPAHMSMGKEHIHEIPLEKLIGPVVVLDVKRKVAMVQEYGVSIKDLFDWERQFGRIPNGAAVIMNSGWDRRYPHPYAVFNTRNISDINTYRVPSWTFQAADWLLTNRRVIAIGVDTPSVDFFTGKTLPVHRRIFRDSVIALEGVANLDSLPPHGATIYIPALKLYQGSGSPTRIFATFPKC
ncbi:Hypothetical predicted protein [Mytilus galloprovincialis]|uniref:Kynurenine formamidase n=2 Tax=Mytilus TaxID=6548 RepID=A0A8B6FAD8_MYTGA|nr:Hypothetical predicted protein [Mytilus galloprovincialis]